MSNGKADHLNAYAVVNQSIGHFFSTPSADIINNAMCLEIENNDTLPPREEYNPLNTKKLSQRMPVNRIAELLVYGVE